ncbi:DNA integrity scanning diadenylate cyclase DisA [Hoyosella subflava]|uniref:DNA integrity scanning protein DisA n=1 Tax=Hoyosella subflava (strain DSM 45089 / JCM 17490 / NBRC 109087 / DQS3-9A1) TaxID=443218 RepID=F6EGY4_HOYSD|nr:DNA integrity scanning diadenylate cyclase DisA [Hoyosella subflava]AEF38808.1 DNA integrity scanning protein DisA [Hoyosella subflava DQS3-9A1]
MTLDPSPVLVDTIARLAPGTGLRDALERILRGRTGALIVLGYDDAIERLCDGGFVLDIQFAPTRLRELAKMDGAVVLSTDGSRIVRANVQLVPDSTIPTEESGTRHRTAERTAIQTGFPVISVSQSMSIASVYVAGTRHVLEDTATILSRANQAIATLERYRMRLDQVTRALGVAEIDDFVSLRDALTVIQRLEMVRRISSEIDRSVIELGTGGRQVALQLEELLGDNEVARRLILLDYVRSGGQPSDQQVDRVLAALESLSDGALLDLTEIAHALGYSRAVETLDTAVEPRGYRLLSQLPRLPFSQIERLIENFGSLQKLLAASSTEFQTVDGISGFRARHISEGLSRLAGSTLENQF